MAFNQLNVASSVIPSSRDQLDSAFTKSTNLGMPATNVNDNPPAAAAMVVMNAILASQQQVMIRHCLALIYRCCDDLYRIKK